METTGAVGTRCDSRSIVYTARFDQVRARPGFLTGECCRGHPELCLPAASSDLETV